MAQLQEAVIVTTTSQGYRGNNAVVVGPGVVDAWTDNRRYNPSGGRTLGILQLLLGLASISCGITIASSPFISGPTTITPAWAGGLYLVAGIFGITSSSRRSCSITGFMVFSILSSLSAFIQTFYQGRIVFWWYFYGLGNLHWIIYFCMAAAVAGLAEFIISIISAAKCCQGATCCKCCWSSCAGCCGPPAVEVDMAVQYGSQVPANQAFVSAPSPAIVNPNPGTAYPNPGTAYPNRDTAYRDPGTAYPNRGTAYPNRDTAAYPNRDTAYPDPGTAYPNRGTAYPNRDTAYPDPGTAYPNRDTAYRNPGTAYPNRGTAYPNRDTAYPDPGTAYPNRGTAYPNRDTAYTYRGTAYPNPGTAYRNQAYYEESKHHKQFGNQ